MLVFFTTVLITLRGNPMNLTVPAVPQALTSVEYMNTQIEIIRSCRIAEGVI